MKKIVYLSGGIGGAKLAKGFYNLKEIDLTIIINTGDDETIQGVKLSPDIDSVIYALAGIEGDLGWGQKNDSFVVSEEFKKYFPQEFKKTRLLKFLSRMAKVIIMQMRSH